MKDRPTSLVTLLATTMFSAIFVSGLQAQQPSMPALDVAEAVVTTEVRDREPVDELTTASRHLEQVVLWTRITGAEGRIPISHVWYRGDEQVARVPLTVAGPNWRTWTSKTLVPEWTGDWRVDVVGPDGGVLETVSFRVE